MNTKLSTFFNVIAQSQTYMNMIYLSLSFPLGIFYFVFLITGLSLGLGLVITLLGIPILFGTLILCRVFARFECQLTKSMLGIDIPYAPIKKSKGFLKKIKTYLNDSFTWKSLGYLFIKFPLGVISFVVLVTLLSVSFGFIATPFLYYLFNIGLLQGSFCIMPGNICFVNSYFATIVLAIIGLFLLFISLHIFNGLARIFGLLTKFILEKRK